MPFLNDNTVYVTGTVRFKDRIGLEGRKESYLPVVQILIAVVTIVVAFACLFGANHNPFHSELLFWAGLGGFVAVVVAHMFAINNPPLRNRRIWAKYWKANRLITSVDDIWQFVSVLWEVDDDDPSAHHQLDEFIEWYLDKQDECGDAWFVQSEYEDDLAELVGWLVELASAFEYDEAVMRVHAEAVITDMRDDFTLELEGLEHYLIEELEVTRSELGYQRDQHQYV